MIDHRVYPHPMFRGLFLIPMNEFSKDIADMAGLTIDETFIPEEYERVGYDHDGIIVKEKDVDNADMLTIEEIRSYIYGEKR